MTRGQVALAQSKWSRFPPIIMEVENGCFWKENAIGDTPIFHFHDYGRKGRFPRVGDVQLVFGFGPYFFSSPCGFMISVAYPRRSIYGVIYLHLPPKLPKCRYINRPYIDIYWHIYIYQEAIEGSFFWGEHPHPVMVLVILGTTFDRLDIEQAWNPRVVTWSGRFHIAFLFFMPNPTEFRAFYQKRLRSIYTYLYDYKYFI